MNEQILKLLDESGLHQSEIERLNIGCKLKKFTELFAKECSRIAMTQHTSTDFDSYEELDSYDKGYDDCASTISSLIRHKFDVK